VTDFLVEHPGGDTILLKYDDLNLGTAESTELKNLKLSRIHNTPSVYETPGMLEKFNLLNLQQATWSN